MFKKAIRTCIGCRLKKEKNNLIRITLNSRRKLIVDKIGKEPGKGAYLCRKDEGIGLKFNKDCLEKAINHKAFNHVFKKQVKDVDIFTSPNSCRLGSC